MGFINRSTLLKFLACLTEVYNDPGRLLLIGETTLLYEDWREWIERIEFTAEVDTADRPGFEDAIRRAKAQLGVELLEESPADLIPLPAGYEERAVPIEMPEASTKDGLGIFHFDPYSVAFRFIARGDEQDYQIVLNYLEHGWVTVEEMDAMLVELLPRFSFETIQQDPAEFRRKYKGLLQMWRAAQKANNA